MFDPLAALIQCRQSLLIAFNPIIRAIDFDPQISQLKTTFATGAALYIGFNEYGEYAYQLLFSRAKGDFIRWDNFDAKWPVETQPHHFHPKNAAQAVASPMIGDPAADMPILINELKKYFIHIN